MVIHRREWRPCIAVSRFAHAQAEIDIVEGDLQALVESSDLLKDLPAHQQAGPGHRRQVLRDQGTCAVPRETRRLMAVSVIGDSNQPENDARVLDSSDEHTSELQALMRITY